MSAARPEDGPTAPSLRRIVVGIAIAVALVAADWMLARRLQQVDLGALEAPAQLTVGETHDLFLETPELRTTTVGGSVAGRSLLEAQEGGARLVSAELPEARLAEDTLQYLRTYLCEPFGDYVPPPACAGLDGTGEVTLRPANFSGAPPAGEAPGACRWSITVAGADGSRLDLHLWEERPREDASTRTLVLRPEREPLTVRFEAIGMGGATTLSCRARAGILGWSGDLSASLPLSVVVPRDRVARLSFTTDPGSQPGFRPIVLRGFTPLLVDSLEVRPCPDCAPVVRAAGREGGRGLQLVELSLASSGLHAEVSGDGLLAGQAAYLPPEARPMARLKAFLDTHLLLGLLWLALNAAAVRLISKYVIEEPAGSLWRRFHSARPRKSPSGAHPPAPKKAPRR